jgi:hypothetical protein
MKFVPLKQIALISLIPLLSFSAVNSTSAESIPDIYRFVPAGTMLTLNIKTSESAWPAGIGNKILNNFARLGSRQARAGSPELDILSDPEIINNLGNNIVFSFSDFDLKSPKASFLFIAEMKNKNLQNNLKSRIKKSYSAKADSQVVESTFKDASVLSIIPKNTKNYKFKPSYFVLLNNYFINTNDLETVQNSVKSYYNSVPDLRNSADFSKSYARLGSDFQMQAYINMKKFGKLLNDMAKEDSGLRALKNQNLFLNESMLLNLHLYSNRIELRSYTIPDKTNKYMAKSLQEHPSTFRSFINYVPKDSLAFAGVSDFNFNDYATSVFTKEQKALYEKLFRDSLGINIRDIANNIKDDSAFAVFNTSATQEVPGFAIFLTPKDNGKMAKTINSFRIDLDAVGTNMNRGNRNKQKSLSLSKKGVLKFSEVKNYRNYNISVTNEVPELSKDGIRPAFTFLDGKVIFASNEQVMKSIIDRVLNNSPDFALEANPSFASLKSYFGNKNNSLGFINLDLLSSIFATIKTGKKDSAEVIDFLKKFHAIGFNSINDPVGVLGRMIILVDIDRIDLDKLLPGNNEIDLNKSKKTF